MYSYDTLLSNRLKFGPYQLKTFSIVSLIDFLDGAEIQYLSFLNVILMKEWDLDMSGLMLLAGSLNFGLFLGAIICIFAADRFGRKNIIVFGSLVQFFTVLATAFVTNLWQMLILKVSYGIVFGITIPLSQILMTECTPLDKRGKTIVSLQIMFIFGRIWIILLAMIFFENLSEGNWRAIALLNSIPCLLCFIGSIVYVQESARFLITHGQFDEGVANCNKIGRENNPNFVQLTDDEISDLRQWQVAVFQQSLEQKSVKGLFNSQNLPFTWRIWTQGIIQSIVFGAIFLLLPFIMADENKTVLQYLYTVIIEIPAVIVVFLLIDNPFWGGRIKMIITGSTFQALTLFVIWYYKERYLVSGITVFKFFTRFVSLAFIPLVNESYDTVYRSMGIGAVQCVTRVSASLAPVIFFPIYQRNRYAMFLYAFLAKLFMISIMSTYPTDHTQKPLDEQHLNLEVREEKEEKNKTD